MTTPPFPPPLDTPNTEAAPGEDTLARFLVRGVPVRGEAVSLDHAWRAAIAQHNYPACVRQQLGELCAAGLLLSASLKFEGSLILQIHGDGPVALLVVECDDRGQFRATAKLREQQHCPEHAPLAQLVNVHGRGRFVVTLDPSTRSPNRQPYQGIVPFEGATVAEVLERYMARSEQVPTRLWLAADDQRAAGLLLQRLPEDGGRPTDSAAQPATAGLAAAPNSATSSTSAHEDLDGWNRMQHLAETIRPDELLRLPSGTLLHRLFWQEPLHAFDQRDLRFECRCSHDKVAAMLKMLGQAEVASIIAEQGSVGVRCDYCNTPYSFDAIDTARIFLSEPSAPGSGRRH